MKVEELAFTIGGVVKFVVCFVEELFVKPKSGDEKKAAAIQLLKVLISNVVDNLPLNDIWKRLLKNVFNWDFILGVVIDKVVAIYNELGIFKKTAQ